MKSHTKSRRGCVQCKHRKVKCDETLPCCDRCRRRHEHCSYLDEVYGSPGGGQAGSGSTTSNNNASSNNNNSNSSNPPSTTLASSGLVTTPGSSSGGSTIGAGPGGVTGAFGPGSFSAAGHSSGTAQHNSYQHAQRGPLPSASQLGMLDTSVGASGSLGMNQSPLGTPLIGPGLADPSNGYVVDMELLHFYLTCTYKTLWGRAEGKLVWRDVIFREALAHPALMNGLLTTAALHRIVTLSATHGPSAAAVYHSVALHKQRQALEGLVVLLRSLDPESCRAIFPLSMMVSFWAFVSRDVPEELGILTTLDINGGIQPPTHNNNHNINSNHASPAGFTDPGTPHQHQQQHITLPPIKSTLDLFVELIRRIRAVQTIAQESISWLTQSQFLPLMAVPNYDTLPALPHGITQALHTLDAHIQRTPRIAAMLSGLDNRYSLSTMYKLSRCPDWLELVTGWPMTLPQSFVDELQRRNHAALTVFAYWLGCFQVLEDRWWARGWTAALIVEIEGTVRGGEWAPLVDWVRMYLSIIK
ncbi:uncharacterized protein B0I36DRAFT_331671 [Microdochium trichocladiopsis]|uniref:Zn(2)-C6 fungal-type domain-containing protein n=1 Tax=Microdochium trichocladiopsis TaxID=1682393 RepID=A0A9P8XXW4_9PEZI|nr:uncharacterized protein B0I36DRAFT_331671 [Microdochium trichocladiopsis]KAH7024590.1 hypothetical protein B0I36DRAFT_331671 [Microdochium trichocladiopsis]